ncbi:MAG TPA: hypothetical protein VD927_08130 [Chryseosolibacter sp.]|nr:hypothetical protein [Chryseosolibacter sp.]
MKILFLRLFIAACVAFWSIPESVAQKQGIGVRIGDPIGATYKRYFGMKAVEFGLGSTSRGLHHAYYRNSFRNHDRFNDLGYKSHNVASTLYLQAKYLIHNEIYVQGLDDRWDWYWGIGAMVKFATVDYRVDDNANHSRTEETFHDVDLGPEGILGMEYTFSDVPISVFADVSLMLEIVNRVTLRPFGGAGARFNF